MNPQRAKQLHPYIGVKIYFVFFSVFAELCCPFAQNSQLLKTDDQLEAFMSSAIITFSKDARVLAR